MAASAQISSEPPHALQRSNADGNAAPERAAASQEASQLQSWEEARLPAQHQAEVLLMIRSMHPAYSTLEIDKVLKKNACYTIAVRGDGERHCLKKGAAHRRSRVYFVLGPQGLAQKCYSRSVPAGQQRPCCECGAARAQVSPGARGRCVRPDGRAKRRVGASPATPARHCASSKAPAVVHHRRSAAGSCGPAKATAANQETLRRRRDPGMHNTFREVQRGCADGSSVQAARSHASAIGTRPDVAQDHCGLAGPAARGHAGDSLL